MNGTVINNQMCNYQISMPYSANPADVLTLTIQYLGNAQATLIRGPSLLNATAKYQNVAAGNKFTLKYGNNFYLNIVGTSSNQVNYVFTIQFTATVLAAA